MKDNFSEHSEQYLKFRPNYPIELYTFLLSICKNHGTAWDCGTGNGQVAFELSKSFDKVYATDISKNQLENAKQAPNIYYQLEPAEKTSFANNTFDLITVAQAIHWFNFDEFYKEVRRTIKPGGIFAVIGYGLCKTGDETEEIISDFYENVIGSYWDKERKYIDEEYKTIPFPFDEIKTPVLTNNFEWSFDQFIGYIQTWSAVQHYMKANNKNPLDLIYDKLKQSWKENTLKNISFPILLRVARIESV